MSQRGSVAEMEDAAFRARLAPLAAAVLPGAGQRSPRSPAIGNRRRLAVAAAVIAAAAAASGGALLYRPQPDRIVVPPPAAQPQPAATAPRAPAPSPAQPAVDPLLGILLERGNAALTSADITAARLLFERAANGGSAAAAEALARTYDVQFLLAAGARATEANPTLAAAWYRRAAALAAAAAPVRADPRDGGKP